MSNNYHTSGVKLTFNQAFTLSTELDENIRVHGAADIQLFNNGDDVDLVFEYTAFGKVITIDPEGKTSTHIEHYEEKPTPKQDGD